MSATSDPIITLRLPLSVAVSMFRGIESPTDFLPPGGRLGTRDPTGAGHSESTEIELEPVLTDTEVRVQSSRGMEPVIFTSDDDVPETPAEEKTK